MFLGLASKIIRSLASTYVSRIELESIPIWKGEATIDDLNINAEGLNKTLYESGSPIHITKISSSRISVKAPVFSAGTKPLRFQLHSADIRLSLLEDPPPPPPEPTDQKEAPPPDPKSYINRLISNILIILDGVFIQYSFQGITIELIITDFECHITPQSVAIRGKHIRGNLFNNKVALKLQLANLEVIVGSEVPLVTQVDITSLSASVSDINEVNSVFFDLIKPEVSANIIIVTHEDGKTEVKVHSASQFNLTIPIQILPSVIEIVNSFPASAEATEFAPLPILDIDVGGIALTIQVSQSLGLLLDLQSIRIVDGKFKFGPISAHLKLIDQLYPIIESLHLAGTLSQIVRKTIVAVSIESLRISIPAQKDMIELLKSVVIPEIAAQEPIELPILRHPVFEEKSCVFKDLPNLKSMARLVEFSFDEPIIPVGFKFDTSVLRAKLIFRVWDPVFHSFIALASIESNGSISSFQLKESQMIPASRFQLLFPEPLTSFPLFMEGSNFYYQSSDSLMEYAEINASIDSVFISVESYDFPIAAISLSSIEAALNIGPINAFRASVSLGISVMLANFRTFSMSSILDIPSLVFQFTQFEDIYKYLKINKWESDTLSTNSLQSSYATANSSLSIRIPTITTNFVGSIIFDIIKFFNTFSINEVIAYKIVNKSNIASAYQVGESRDLIIVEPDEEKIITFEQNEMHYITFPNEDATIIFNSPGYYHLTDYLYAKVDVTSPYAFVVTLLASNQFINNLKMNIEISLYSQTHEPMIKQVITDLVSTVFDNFTLSIRVPDITEWSEPVFIKSSIQNPPMLLSTEVINMLPRDYLCAPNFSCWLTSRTKEISCLNETIHLVNEYMFIPLLSIKNRLDTYLLTSSGSIPPRASRYISCIYDDQIILDNIHSIPINYPLKRIPNRSYMIQGVPAIIEAIQSKNTITISPSFVFRNDTSIRLFFKVYLTKEIPVEPGEVVPLSTSIEPDWISIGVEDKEGLSWSPPIQIPARKDFIIKTTTGNMMLCANFTEFSALISPKIVTINESSVPIWIKPATKIEPDSQTQLLVWRGKQHVVSFGYSKNAGFSKPISLSQPATWVRKFVMNEPGQSHFYFTYSIQNTIDPNAIVFHEDTCPPFTIINVSPLNFQVYLGKHVVVVTGNTTIYLHKIPKLLKMSRFGASPFTVSLQLPVESLVAEQGETTYVRVERRGRQVKVTLSLQALPSIRRPPRFNFSLFVSDLKVFVFNDFSEPGPAKHVLSISLSPISTTFSAVNDLNTAVSLTIDTFQIDNVGNFERFPVILQKASYAPLLNFSAEFLTSYNEAPLVQSIKINLQPFKLDIEESFVRFIVSLITLIVPAEEPHFDEDEEQIGIKMHPYYIKYLEIVDTKIILSLSTQSILDADFRKVPIILSGYKLMDTELFPITFFSGLIQHYASDVLAAIPSFLASLSLIGSPVNLVNQSLAGLKDFYISAVHQSDSLIFGIGRGSMNLVRGVTSALLESFVSLTYSLEKSIRKLTPYETEDEENRRIGQELMHAISGIVVLPVREFQEDGLIGIAKGAGKGILGIITVPTVAAFSLLKRTGVALLHTVGDEDESGDGRIEKEVRILPTILLNE